MSEHSPEYIAYLASPAWKAERQRALRRASYRCERCGARATEVNHKTYARLGRELPKDLEALCSRCHLIADYERQQHGTPEQAADRYSARLRGWASKRYGPDDSGWPDDVEARFERWLEQQGEGP